MPVGSIFEEEVGRERERVGDFMCFQIPTQFLCFLFCFSLVWGFIIVFVFLGSCYHMPGIVPGDYFMDSVL